MAQKLLFLFFIFILPDIVLGQDFFEEPKKDYSCSGWQSSGTTEKVPIQANCNQQRDSNVSGSTLNWGLSILAIILAALIVFMKLKLSWRSPLWSPYVAGSGVGIVAAISVSIKEHPLSASGFFNRAISRLGHFLIPQNNYFDHLRLADISWELSLLSGIFLGSLFSALLSQQFRIRTMPDTQWSDDHGPSVIKRWVMAFAGAAVIQIGADVAGGCTSGLAISGGILLAPAAFLFMMGMFAGGIPTALFWKQRRNK